VEKKGYHIAHEASLVVSEEYTGLHGREEYNAAVAHVCDLTLASYALFISGSYAPSVFYPLLSLKKSQKLRPGTCGRGEKNEKR
jgi:hypothetical protein